MFRFRSGLNILGLLDEMKKCPVAFEKVFLHHEESITAVKLLDEIFADTKFSLRGSNARLDEADTICFWRDYVMEVEGKD